MRLAGLVPEAQRGERGGEDVERGRVVALPAARHHRRVARLTERTHDPGARPERQVVEAPAVRVGAARPVAAERDIDHPGVDGADLLEAEAVPLHAMASQVGDEDIRAGGQPPNEIGAAGTLEIHRDRALAPVVELERGQDLRVRRIRLQHAAEGIAPGRLDLHDISAEVGHEGGGGRRGEPVRDLKHANLIKGRCHRTCS